MANAGSGRIGDTLLEREPHLAKLEKALCEVRANSTGRLVVLAGEAGAGKTALLRRFCRDIAGSSHVMWGACAPLRTPRPLGPLVDVAEATGGELEELVTAAERPYEIASALLRELRRRALTVLVLEDLQWADEATIDVLALLGTRIATTTALVLVSYRDDELDRTHQLRVVLGEVVRGPGRVRVDPLSERAVLELAASHDVDGEELFARTGGNPFFVTEVLATERQEVPETVRDAVLARTARLSEGARGLLDAASVIPVGCELGLLAELAAELVEHLSECVASGILVAVDGAVLFRHDLARLAVEGSLPPDRKRALHRRALAVLAGRQKGEADASVLAHHAELAGDVEAVLVWAPRAAEVATASGAHREAAAQYARALRHANSVAPDERAILLERRAEECYLTAQVEEAIDAQRAAVEIRRGLGDLRGEGNALRALSRLMFFAGRTTEGEPIAVEAVALLERGPPCHELAMAYCNVSQRRMVVDEREAAIEWGTRALQLAERLGDTEAALYALTNIGMTEADIGIAHGREKLERALELARSTGLDEHAGRIFNALVMWPIRLRRFGDIGTHLEDGLAFCEQRGLDTWRLYLLACRAALELMRGAWDAAADSAEVVLRNPRSAHVARVWGLTVRGLIRTRRGDPEAETPLAQAHEHAESTTELTQIGPETAARAELAWLAGDDDAVQRITEPVLALALEREVVWTAGELAFWRWQAGVRDDLPPNLLAEPYRLSIAGEWAEAARLWKRIGCPYEAALALAGADQEPPLRQALEELRDLGARPAAAIVTRRLRALGARGLPRGPRPSTRENPAGLTTREFEVLALLAEGLRNAQIAERLIVAQKTVDHHVSAILRKLDAPTRGQAAATAIRLGLLQREAE
ncbi:MAG TPA: AAA family ATPase [Solirubrobacteraceae bacterium]|nr:AAA family ATPase [Solirubrobacteraceae bacterium]